jgi:uncharacterized protein (TIGR01370 family)
VLAEPPSAWVVTYSDQPAAWDLAAYDLVVLDLDRHPPLGPIVERRRTVLAYLSLTQIGRHRALFPRLAQAGVLFQAHPVWSDAHYVDFRRPEWTRAVLEELIPQAVDRGFSGLFLDTLDDAEFLESSSSGRFQGARRAAIGLVKAIRQNFPDLHLMANRGYALMPDIARELDTVMGESVLGTFDPTTKVYRRVSDADAAWQIDQLRQARRRNPKLHTLTLDYWDPADAAGVRRLYAEERALGFVPYVSTPLLDRILREPK